MTTLTSGKEVIAKRGYPLNTRVTSLQSIGRVGAINVAGEMHMLLRIVGEH